MTSRSLSPACPPKSSACRAALAMLVVFAALLAAPVAAQAAGWTDGPAFAADQNSPTNSRLAAGPDGSLTEAWINDPALTLNEPSVEAPLTVEAQRLDADGNPGQVFKLATSKADSYLLLDASVAVATGAGGTTAIAWELPDQAEEFQVGVSFLDPAGNLLGTRAVATLPERSGLAVAVAPSGAATVAYRDEDPVEGTVMVAAHVTPSSSTTTVLAHVVEEAGPAVAAGAGGIAWVAWGDDEGSKVARLAADGSIAVAPQPIGVDATAVTLTASADGSRAAVAAVEPATLELIGARLAANGTLMGGKFAIPPGFKPDPEEGPPVTYVPSMAVGADGTVTVAYALQASQVVLALVRIPAGVPGGTPQPLAGPGGGIPFTPAVAVRADGTALVAWLNLKMSEPLTPRVFTRTVAADGTLGPQLDAGAAGTVFIGPEATAAGSALVPLLGDDGEALLGVPAGTMLGATGWFGSHKLRRLDLTPPVVDASIPSDGVVGTPVAFNATTAGHGPVTLAWDFGDGSHAGGASVTHTFGASGTYTVKLTATDGSGNETLVQRALKIAPVPAPTSTPAATPAATSAPKAARLKVTKAMRRGSRVTIRGTISPAASGTTTITYKQKVGRAALSIHKRARIARGHWQATITLPRRLAVPGRATVFVTYAGDDDTLPDRALRTVTTAKPKKK